MTQPRSPTSRDSDGSGRGGIADRRHIAAGPARRGRAMRRTDALAQPAVAPDTPVLIVGRCLEGGWFRVRNPGGAALHVDTVFTSLRVASRASDRLPGAALPIGPQRVALRVERIEIWWRSVEWMAPGDDGLVQLSGMGLETLVEAAAARERSHRCAVLSAAVAADTPTSAIDERRRSIADRRQARRREAIEAASATRIDRLLHGAPNK
jgi:hypothetical protein